MSQLQRKTELLEDMPLFRSCTRKALARIAAGAEERELAQGSVLTVEGELGSSCFVLVSGWARVTQGGRDLAVLGPGSIVGEMALLDAGPRTATVVAETPLHLLSFDPRRFEDFLAEAPVVGHHLLRVLSERLRAADQVRPPRDDGSLAGVADIATAARRHSSSGAKP